MLRYKESKRFRLPCTDCTVTKMQAEQNINHRTENKQGGWIWLQLGFCMELEPQVAHSLTDYYLRSCPGKG